MIDDRPIGVFDSGLGGLCAVKELRRLLPKEDIVYFGDTGRVPYGSKSPQTIIKYARQDAAFLKERGVKLILAACGTVSAVALDTIKDDFEIKMFGVVDDAVSAAVQKTKSGSVAVIGTSATIESGVFDKKLRAAGIEKVVSQACPLFVHLVECGFTDRDNEITKGVCRTYLSDIKDCGADTLILGCTHFPIIADIISDFLPGVTLIDPAQEAAASVAEYIASSGIGAANGGKTSYFVSDDGAGFAASAGIFLGNEEKITAQTVNIQKI